MVLANLARLSQCDVLAHIPLWGLRKSRWGLDQNDGQTCTLDLLFVFAFALQKTAGLVECVEFVNQEDRLTTADMAFSLFDCCLALAGDKVSPLRLHSNSF